MKTLLFTILLLTFTFATKAQEATPTPPKVEILASTADKCADCFVERRALKSELETVKAEYEKVKAELIRTQIDLSKLAGEKNGSDAMVIRLSSMVDLLLKQVRPKKIGLINF